MNKKLKYSALILGLIVIVTAIWLSNRIGNIKNFPPQGDKILAFGDSLVLGIGSTTGNDFVSQTSRLVGKPIANLGAAGDTTQSALLRLDAALKESPDIVIVLIGGNDALRRISKAETESNLRRIVSEFQENGAVVLLLGVRGGLLGDPYDKMYGNIAGSTGSIHIPDVLDGLFGDSRYMSDAIHPNDDGYQIIALRVADELSKILEAIES